LEHRGFHVPRAIRTHSDNSPTQRPEPAS
jgi:hypothetical protein